MKLNGIRLMHPLHLIVALGVLWMSTTGCSLQKRTTTRGFHIEKRSARVHVPVVAEAIPPTKRAAAPFKLDQQDRLAPLNTLPAQPMGTSLNQRRRFFDEANSTSRLDTASQTTQAPESHREKFKNSILAVLGRPNNLDTASQVIDVPPAQLNELREEARKASRWNFLLGLFHLPLSIIQGEDYLIFQGIGFLVLGWYIKRLAQDDAKLLAWEERRQLERQRRQNRTWWQWLLIGLGVASLFVLTYLFAAASVGVWIL